jgi:hypothetical protein
MAATGGTNWLAVLLSLVVANRPDKRLMGCLREVLSGCGSAKRHRIPHGELGLPPADFTSTIPHFGGSKLLMQASLAFAV